MIQTCYPEQNAQCASWACLVYNRLNSRVTFAWRDEKKGRRGKDTLKVRRELLEKKSIPTCYLL